MCFQSLLRFLCILFSPTATLSNSVKVCPYPLLMIACQLLLEITAFLRESHGQYSMHKPASRPLHRFLGRRKHSVVTNRRSIVLSPESQMRHGGLKETVRRSSVWSQASLPTDFTSSLSRTLQEPPTITVSETDPSSQNLDAMDWVKRERGDSTSKTGNRSSLYFPRHSTQVSPKSARKAGKRNPMAGEGDLVKSRSKSTKRLSADPTSIPGDEEESDEEDLSANLPWMSAVIHLNSSTVFMCDHHGMCPSNCHQRQSRSCNRMTRALKAVYSSASKLDKGATKATGRGHGSPLISGPQFAGMEQSSHREKDDEEMIKYIASSVSLACQQTHLLRVLEKEGARKRPPFRASFFPSTSNKCVFLQARVNQGCIAQVHHNNLAYSKFNFGGMFLILGFSLHDRQRNDNQKHVTHSSLVCT